MLHDGREPREICASNDIKDLGLQDTPISAPGYTLRVQVAWGYLAYNWVGGLGGFTSLPLETQIRSSWTVLCSQQVVLS